MRGRVWGCLTGRTGEPGAGGSQEVGAGVAGGTGAAKRGMVGTGMGREVRGRSLPPAGWVGLRESRSFS